MEVAWRSPRLYQRAFVLLGSITSFGKGNVQPTNTTGGPWKPKGNKGGTNSIEQPWTLTLSNCIRYSMLTWELHFGIWSYQLGGLSLGYFINQILVGNVLQEHVQKSSNWTACWTCPGHDLDTSWTCPGHCINSE